MGANDNNPLFGRDKISDSTNPSGVTVVPFYLPSIIEYDSSSIRDYRGPGSATSTQRWFKAEHGAQSHWEKIAMGLWARLYPILLEHGIVNCFFLKCSW